MSADGRTHLRLPTRSVQESSPQIPGLRRLIIVSRDELGLYKSLKRAFADAERIEVILDRRFRGRRQRLSRPLSERRRGDRRSRAVAPQKAQVSLRSRSLALARGPRES